jgi:hypothetical protein
VGGPGTGRARVGAAGRIGPKNAQLYLPVQFFARNRLRSVTAVGKLLAQYLEISEQKLHAILFTKFYHLGYSIDTNKNSKYRLKKTSNASLQVMTKSQQR